MSDIIQFKRGPSTKLDKQTTYDGEPIFLTDLNELLICRSNQDPVVFREYTKYIQMEKIADDFENANALGKLWMDYKYNLKVGVLVNGAIKIISFNDIAYKTDISDMFTDDITNINTRIDNIINGTTPIGTSSADKLTTPRYFYLSGDATGQSLSAFDGSASVTIKVDISAHKNTIASSGQLGHIKLGTTLSTDEMGITDVNFSNVADGKTVKSSGSKFTAMDVAIGGNTDDLASTRGQIGDIASLGYLAIDLNNITKSGNFYVDAGATNTPTGKNGYITVINAISTIAQSFYELPSNNTYYRYYTLSTKTWSDWNRPIYNTDIATTTKAGISKVGPTMLINSGILDVDKQTILNEAYASALELAVALG